MGYAPDVGVLAIDPGTKKFGFAYADRLRIVKRALDPLRTEGDEALLFKHVATLIDERDVATILVGMPLHLSGEASEQGVLVQALVERIRARFPEQRVSTYDERLTTKEAESRLRDLGYSGREIRTRKDSWAALVLLEDWVLSGEPA
jgi:putative Holliday junction resolvase